MTTGNSVCVLLRHNPTVTDNDLSGVIRANLVGFQGKVSVKTANHSFALGTKKARVIYITPYGNFSDFCTSLKRTLVGVDFPALANNGSHITNYVLGLLVLNSQEYNEAKQEAEHAWSQGRRFVVAISTDCLELNVSLDENCSGICVIT